MHNLAACPKTKIHFEPFNQHEEKRAEVDGKKCKTSASSAHFLNNRVFSSAEPTETIECKLFFFHCREDARSADIWQHLKDRRDIKLIFMNRRNLLDRHLSDLRAQKSGIWHPKNRKNWTDDYAEAVEVKVDIQRMMHQLNSLYATLHNIKADFENHDLLEVTYEDLASNSECILTEVTDYLQVENSGTKSSFKSGTLTNKMLRILNEKEVIDRLNASVFSRFLVTSTVLQTA
ncbi:Stf0 family sulfotransferase [uncultured Tateyamaria sp.]|uniref:Stf0 family sulfotransferase n=1 Tax=uncultured Tateyamaria sp. TaxID=455651 RepID=UPI00261D2919|nr:Stf0 family sulfotransferase [uncultured Tateyamaria sp.]